MTRLALCLLLLATLAGCQPDCWESDPSKCRPVREKTLARYSVESLSPGIDVIHDHGRSVTCWRYAAGQAGGLSCMPDWMLRGPDQADNQRQLSPHETQPEPTPALAPGRWIDERYQL
ncbi:hypothetical protein LU676_14020 [Pseudomonas alloputida]|uniref:hypothetical protein n=1 Tax=Pseudomonas alloputida TaxID=1940621 RepID=UPI001E52184B|nr:hypothetical protein [Pseudomonas alloputida]MCE0903870.1 hypothetical protein [Pseudomonas alloputida]